MGDSGWMVAPTSDGAGIIFYNRSGVPVRRLGQRGEGPGEFEWISFTTVDPQGTITAFDPFRRRATEFDRNSQLGRTIPLDHSSRNPPVMLNDGWYLVPTAINTSERAGMPLHLMDPEGVVRFSFGSETVPDGVINGRRVDRAVALASDSTVWAAQRVDPILEHWTLDGRLLQLVEYRVDWFPGQPPRHDPATPVRASPLLSDLFVSATGELLLLVQVKDSLRSARSETPTGLDADDVASTRRTHLVVVSETGELLGETELNGYFSHFVRSSLDAGPRPPMVAEVTADVKGAAQLVVSRLGVDSTH